MSSKGIHEKAAIAYLLLAASLLFFLKIPAILNNPFFVGDSGFRMDHAGNILLIAGNRVWLPFLQIHIWLFYKLGAPYGAYKFIPAFYFLIACFSLGLLTFRILNKNLLGLLFSLFLMICFSFQREINFISVNLYQEIITIALFNLLLCLGALALRKTWAVLIIASIGLLTRESFFIYLFVLTVLNYTKINADKKYIFSLAWLWTLLMIWMAWYFGGILIAQGHYPQWPWMVNKVVASTNFYSAPHHLGYHPASGHGNSLLSLLTTLWTSRSCCLLLTLMIGLPLTAFYRKAPAVKDSLPDRFDDDFKIFSLLSLIIIYLLFLSFDPWQNTFGNPRMVIPLLTHLFIWSGILYKQSLECPPIPGFLVRLVLIASLVFTAAGHHDMNKTNADRSFKRIENLRKTVYKDHAPRVCVIGKNYWASVALFIAPTLYMDREFIKSKHNHSFNKDDIVIAPSAVQFENINFTEYDAMELFGTSYIVYCRKPVNEPLR